MIEGDLRAPCLSKSTSLSPSLITNARVHSRSFSAGSSLSDVLKRCFINSKVNSVLIEFGADGLVCAIIFTSVPAGADPSRQPHTGREKRFFLRPVGTVGSPCPLPLRSSAPARFSGNLGAFIAPFLSGLAQPLFLFASVKVFTI